MLSLRNSPASEFYMPTFRNTVPSSHLPACDDGTECSETSEYKFHTPWELIRRKYTALRTRRKFEIKKIFYCASEKKKTTNLSLNPDSYIGRLGPPFLYSYQYSASEIHRHIFSRRIIYTQIIGG